jgi:hypothetical protein
LSKIDLTKGCRLEDLVKDVIKAVS